MRKNRWIGLLACVSLVACQTPVQEPPPIIQYVEPLKALKNVDFPPFDSDVLATEIEIFLDDIGPNEGLHQPDSIRNYYALREFQPYWISVSDTLSHADFLNILNLAEMHGLDRDAYHYKQLATNLENLSFFYFETGEINYYLWAESEILLTDGLLLLANHLKQGVFNPLLNEEYYYFIPSEDTVFDPFEIFSTDSLWSFFQELACPNKPYEALQKEYAKRLEKPEKSRTSKDVDTLNTLRVNLERWRWNPLLTDSVRVVYINIPAFRLDVVEADSVRLSSKVCVGVKRPKIYTNLYLEYLKNPESTPKPGHNETPMLKSTISYLVLNPEWRVPNNIAKNEILRSIQKDSTYLNRMGYHIYLGNKLIDPHSVDWQAVSAKNFPYRIEQSAGEKNAMGKMKFMFPNRFSVYLHDTPSKKDYSRRNRAVSHGCVRVENYLELATVLLSEMPRYDLAYLRKTMGLDRNTPTPLQTVNLFFKTKIPIIIDYKTAEIDERGKLHLHPDVYERDKLVLEALGSSL